MFKEAICTMLIASMPLNTTLAELSSKNVYQRYTNIYTDIEYDINNELAGYIRYEVIEYDTAYFGTSFNIEARSIRKTVRYPSDDDYLIDEIMVLKINNNANLTLHELSFTTTPWIPEQTKLLDTPYFWLSKYTNDTYTEPFIDGQQFNSFQDIKNTYINIRDRYTTAIHEIVEVADEYYVNYQNPDVQYYEIQIQAEYNATNINDNGAFLDNQPPCIQILRPTIGYEIPEDYTYEVVDIPGLMFEIIGMPFAWMSIAFNFTIFPGTPYALNISHLLLALIVSLIAIYLIKRILK